MTLPSPPPPGPQPSGEPAGAGARRERSGFDLLHVHEAATLAETSSPDDPGHTGVNQARPATEGSTAVLPRPGPAGPKDSPDTNRVDRELFLRESGRHEAAGRILGAGLVCFALWMLFDANQLYHSALSSPEGARRTVSLTITRPLAALSNSLGLSLFVNWGDHMLGRGSGTPGAGTYRFPTPAIPLRPQVTRLPNGSMPRPHVAGTGTLPPPLPPPPDRLPPLLPPTAAHRLTILDIGDSIGQDLGYGLGETFTGHPAVNVVQKAVESTGLSRPDYYNWPAELQTYLDRYHPGAVVVMLGANDEQALDENGHFVSLGSRAWLADYTSRVALMMNEAYAAGARVLWVGLPPMDSPNVSSGFARQVNAIFRAQAATHPGVTYFPSWDLLSGPNGQFTQYKRVDGNETQIRYPDGVHLTPEGWDLLGAALVRPMEQAWGVRLP
jgi:lysophospholipase L1-like esterase